MYVITCLPYTSVVLYPIIDLSSSPLSISPTRDFDRFSRHAVCFIAIVCQLYCTSSMSAPFTLYSQYDEDLW